MANLKEDYQRMLTLPGAFDAIRQSLYDTLIFDSGVSNRLEFFQQTQGAAGKAVTNMQFAGQLPKGQKFVADAIEIEVYPGSVAAGYTRQNPVLQAAAVAAPNFANDVWALGEAGWVEVVVGTGKPYLIEAPLFRFPPSCGLVVGAAVEQNLAAAAAQTISADYARFAGRPYHLDPKLPLDENTPFNVSLNWPAAFALPSGFDAKVRVRLTGILFRPQ